MSHLHFDSQVLVEELKKINLANHTTTIILHINPAVASMLITI